jgi:outer membrane receptor protein involved in Fe transport
MNYNKLFSKGTFTALIILLSVFNSGYISAQKQKAGTVSGTVMEKMSGNAVEFATVVIKAKSDSTILQGTVTDKNGKFKIDNIPFGDYKVTVSFIGFNNSVTPVFSIDALHQDIKLGTLLISGSTSALDEVVVKSERSTYVNTIDRKVFNVGKDLTSKTGSVSDLMQNIPSVTVDIDGVVSLRGSSSVMILINGKPSALMGANRAAVLQQMPASTIERIEVITNPSAKYKPDGTSGIINIVLKKNKLPGFNGSVTANAGNDNRLNANILGNYNPGKLNIAASYSIRQDDRIRITNDSRTRTDSVTGNKSYIRMNSNDHSRPLSNIVTSSVDYKINERNSIGVSGSYNYRDFKRNQNNMNQTLDNIMILTKDYDRINRGSQFEKDLEFGATANHSFAKEGHELNFDFVASTSKEQENNHYSNLYRFPFIDPSYDNTIIIQADKESQATLEYINPLSETAKLEAGYVFEYQYSDMNFLGEALNPVTHLWENDIQKTNQFIYSTDIHVLYGTFEKEFGRFGFLGGFRAEEALVNTRQVPTDTKIHNNYFRLYPSLHLSYKLSENHELQLNYSHRISRPEGDQLNPFPEYQDPYNLRQGNPKLKPADIHSIETGYQYKNKNVTFLSTVYYRYLYNGMTSITRYMNDTVLLTTTENLSKSQSIGLELVLTTNINNLVNLNLSTNTYYNTIDASSLGYSSNKSTVTWSANLSAGVNITKSTVLQITSNYIARRLTPQGEMMPSFVMNTGFRQEFLKGKAAMIITVSDIFNSLRNNSVIDTPELYQSVMRRRSARIIYAGFTYVFGSQNKKKETQIKYDTQF